ncbi:hypothetical protein E6R18_32880 [Streptomyces sp. A1277]|uniref:hypothetical protein n=1 Tax=Streptomyces sp. A1277 TaxID=2563103 RepID=UPI0010A25162|nr:hypothetical protein [Streptomyces sp. A1277]THA22743.1 hypothetical protein E6R18_32880 [Streptomyces sp. A1277]
MSYLTVEQRGDLAEAMLPVAAHMAALVHGDGGPEDVQDVLGALTVEQRTALIVVLAGLVDPDQTMDRLLGWLDRDEHGNLTVPAWEDRTRCRDLAPDDESPDEGLVDPVAVRLYLQGIPGVVVSDAEFLLVLEHAEAQGITMNELDRRRGVGRKTHADRVNRLRKRYQRAGLELPPGLATGKGQAQPEFTDAEVVQIRKRAAAGGITDLELAVQSGRTRQAIGRLLSGVSYRHVGGPIRTPHGPKSGAASREEFAGHTGPAPTADMEQAS